MRAPLSLGFAVLLAGASTTAVLHAAPPVAQTTPVLMVDRVPTGAVVYGETELRFPFDAIAEADRKDIEANLSDAVGQLKADAASKHVDYVCLLSPHRSAWVSLKIAGLDSELKLATLRPRLVVVYYKAGPVPVPDTFHVNYSLAKPNPAKVGGAITFEKLSIPPSVTDATWVYFNLPRVQEMAQKAGIRDVFVSIAGTGSQTPVAIPGAPEELEVPDEGTKITYSWYPAPAAKTKAPSTASAAP